LEQSSICLNRMEEEIALFPNVKVFLLMGDVTIKALKPLLKVFQVALPVCGCLADCWAYHFSGAPTQLSLVIEKDDNV
jgi:uracil-DNA glycosylase